MITGLQVTVPAAELRTLAEERAAYHAERADTYGAQVQSMDDAGIDTGAQNGSYRDPRETLKEKQREHLNSARELAFIASHLDAAETYLLGRDDLARLGILHSRF